MRDLSLAAIQFNDATKQSWKYYDGSRGAFEIAMNDIVRLSTMLCEAFDGINEYIEEDYFNSTSDGHPEVCNELHDLTHKGYEESIKARDIAMEMVNKQDALWHDYGFKGHK